MNQLITCLCIYNEVQFLERCIKSIYPLVDGFVVVDGAFKDYPHDFPWSTDGTLEILENMIEGSGKPYVLVGCRRPWPDQIAKRNEYLKWVDDGDWVFIVDGDWEVTFLYGALETIKEGKYDGYKVEIQKRDERGVLHRFKWGNPLIIRKVPGMHYAFNHYSIYDEAGRHMYFPPYSMGDLSDLVKIHHWGEHRSPERLKANWEYYDQPLEYASGVEGEAFICCNCDHVFHLEKGELIKCPRCGFGRVAAHLGNQHAG